MTGRITRLMAGLAVLAVPVVLSVAGPAHADCTDFPQPEVNWRRCYHDGRGLQGVDLTGAMLRDATFQRSDLSYAVLTDADAFRAKFVSATLVHTVLDGARLMEADLTRADLSGASLRGTDLRYAKLVFADLTGADLTGAEFRRTDLRNADLSGATWIDGKRVCGEGSIGQCKFQILQPNSAIVRTPGENF